MSLTLTDEGKGWVIFWLAER